MNNDLEIANPLSLIRLPDSWWNWDLEMLVLVHGPGHLRCTSKRDQLGVIRI